MLGFLFLVANGFNDRAPDLEQPINRLGRIYLVVRSNFRGYAKHVAPLRNLN